MLNGRWLIQRQGHDTEQTTIPICRSPRYFQEIAYYLQDKPLMWETLDEIKRKGALEETKFYGLSEPSSKRNDSGTGGILHS